MPKSIAKRPKLAEMGNNANNDTTAAIVSIEDKPSPPTTTAAANEESEMTIETDETTNATGTFLRQQQSTETFEDDEGFIGN